MRKKCIKKLFIQRIVLYKASVFQLLWVSIRIWSFVPFRLSTSVASSKDVRKPAFSQKLLIWTPFDSHFVKLKIIKKMSTQSWFLSKNGSGPSYGSQYRQNFLFLSCVRFITYRFTLSVEKATLATFDFYYSWYKVTSLTRMLGARRIPDSDK